MKKLSQAIALAGVMTAAAVPAVQAEVEVSASAAVANMYLWRGQDLGQGVPAVSGDLVVSSGGAYGGVWTSSGDSALGQEYDLFLGYGGEAGDFSYDVSAWTYVYSGSSTEDGDTRGNTFEATDIIVSLGYAGGSFSYYYPVGNSNPDDYSYMTLGYGMDKFSATVGVANSDADKDTYTHLDLGYAYNDNISFTLSKVVAQEADLDKGEKGQDEDLKVVVSYSLPIEL
ncbi:TorF family putative porin [Bacterioplanoides sp.]|uniref:TorF family putative porin n=1 Tax=Bacterioplanoides sp. TaxID=2066072 RepID=UPI003B59B1BF